MAFEGQLDIDFTRGVIWFNNQNGCRLRICGLKIPKDYDASKGMIEMTFGVSTHTMNEAETSLVTYCE